MTTTLKPVFALHSRREHSKTRKALIKITAAVPAIAACRPAAEGHAEARDAMRRYALKEF